jgi:hypothetical protein
VNDGPFGIVAWNCHVTLLIGLPLHSAPNR